MIHTTLYAHHKGVDHGNAGGGNGNGNGNGHNVPEINGDALWLSIFMVVCVWMLIKNTYKKT
jgi:hypothetical protein